MRQTPRVSRPRAVVAALLFLATGCAAPWPREVRTALSQAGRNRPELERVLTHYRSQKDPQKLAAAEFVVANMPGHGYVVYGLYDEAGAEVPFDALSYGSFAAAQAALDELERERGTLDFKRKRFDPDLETVSAAFLIENIDLAFQAWHEKPWARGLSFEAFCQHVLPYRGSNEPLVPWRAACLARYADLPAQVADPTDPQAAGQALQRAVDGWIRFSDLFYLHPTDQGFDEMCTRQRGRCEDITNMQMYALRANAVAAASDYTPFWADRDNNHAWQVILDAAGRGRAPLFHRAAKIYRKTFALQPASLGALRRKDEPVPGWLGGRNYIDVTEQYMDTTDVTVTLTTPPPPTARFAYICVFNGGEWQPVHWAWIRGRQATFTKLGRHVAYLPAYYSDDAVTPAAPPFLLDEAGTVRLLDDNDGPPQPVALQATNPGMIDQDTRAERAVLGLEAGRSYELFAWQDGWRSLGTRTAGDEPLHFENVPAGRLYWLVAEGSRRLERIFTTENGQQVFW